MKLVKNTKLFVDLTNIMVVHIMNNEIGCFNQFILDEWETNFLLCSMVIEQQAISISDNVIALLCLRVIEFAISAMKTFPPILM